MKTTGETGRARAAAQADINSEEWDKETSHTRSDNGFRLNVA